MKRIQMIDAHADNYEVTVEKYARYKMDGNEFRLLMYDKNHKKYMAIVQEICGALYQIPYECDISSAELVENIDINSLPSCILPALRYDSRKKNVNKIMLKLIGLVAETECQWFSNPQDYFLQNSEYRFSQSKKDEPKSNYYEETTSLPTFECDRYIVFNKELFEHNNIRKFAYMPHKPVEPASDMIDENSSISFSPAPSLETIIPAEEINNIISSGQYTGYRIDVASVQITKDVKPGTTLVAPLTMPDGTTLSFQTLALPCRHKYNVYFGHDVYGYTDCNYGLGTAKITVKKMSSTEDSPKILFRDGISGLRKIKIGEKQIESTDYSYALDQEMEYRYRDPHK